MPKQNPKGMGKINEHKKNYYLYHKGSVYIFYVLF